MAVPDIDVHRVLLWAGKRNPPQLLREVRIEVDVTPVSITIFECRPPWNSPDRILNRTRLPIARLRYTASSSLWTLYWRDRNLQFHRYDGVPASASVEHLLGEIDRDPTGSFWG